MQNYHDSFLETHAYTTKRYGAETNPKLPPADQCRALSKNVLREVSEHLFYHFEEVAEMDDKCFVASALTSSVLCVNNVPHALTIGDVRYTDGILYIGATRKNLNTDIKKGFNPKLTSGMVSIPSAKAHCWITLPNGAILDPTIITHALIKNGHFHEVPDRFEDAIFRLGNGCRYVSEHIPLLTGTTYIQKAVTGKTVINNLPVFEANHRAFSQWADLYCNSMQH